MKARLEKLDEDYDPFAEKEYMKLEPTLANGAVKSTLKMPQTWQEYQFLQQKMATFASEPSLSDAAR